MAAVIYLFPTPFSRDDDLVAQVKYYFEKVIHFAFEFKLWLGLLRIFNRIKSKYFRNRLFFFGLMSRNYVIALAPALNAF